MKRFQAIRVLRRAGLLKLADSGRFMLRRARSASRNRRFLREHPGYAVPPAEIAFDALNHVDWPIYHESGLRHAGVFARIIGAAFPQGPIEVLEWGCGPARLIRHLPGLLAPQQASLTGSDYNPRTIEWCGANLKGIRFVLNQLRPPLSVEADRFHAVYNFSVFTHLSEDVQLAWAAELTRVLRPGGLLVCTTHGKNYLHLLATDQERAAYDAGDVVVQGNYAEGRKWFFAIHPDRFVREKLLGSLVGVQRIATRSEDGMLQDVWIGWKGHVPAHAAEAMRAIGGQ
jgi:SAM-dependent methyltransferase